MDTVTLLSHMRASAVAAAGVLRCNLLNTSSSVVFAQTSPFQALEW
jgi:hypothetical protein